MTDQLGSYAIAELPVLLTIEGMAQLFDTSVCAIRHQRSRGQLPPAHHISGRLFWMSAEVVAWMAAQPDHANSPKAR